MRLSRLVQRPLLLLAALPVLVILAAVAFGVVSAPGAQDARAAAGLKGDVNCSGAVGAADGLQVVRSRAALPLTAACLASAGDVDCSGAVDITDGLNIFRYVAGVAAPTPDGCTPIGQSGATGPNSYQLIQAALDAGDINAETALTYKIFVTFSDPRLPAAYQGEDAGVWDDPMAVAQASATWDTLSPATQAVLAPFLLAPDAPGSWQPPAPAGSVRALNAPISYFGDTSSPHVIIWYRQDRPQDEVLARTLANEVENKIWGQLTGLMGPPKPDTGRDNNYDDRIDVYLRADATRAYAESTPPCNETSGFIVLGANYSDKYVLTHELMHVINYHFNLSNCWYDEYRWVHEATSQWAMDFVYPDAQKERGTQVPSCFLDHPTLPVEYRNDCHEYAAYLFMFYLHRNYDKQYIRKIWDAFLGEDSLGGINAALAPLGGLKEIWPKFAIQNFNREPRTNYKDEDGIREAAALEANEDVSLGGAHKKKYTLRGDAEHLTAFYHQYKFTDSNIKELTFKHSLSGQPTASVKVLIKYQGDPNWVEEDWTPNAEKKFCYDDPGQKKFEKLVIIISNSEYQNRSHILTSDPQPELTVKDQCGLTGTIVGTYHRTDGYTEDWTVTADIEWVEDPNYLFGCPCRVFFPVGDIDWQWSVGWEADYSDPPCHETDSGHLLAGEGLDHVAQQWLVLWDDPANPDQYHYSGHGYVPAMWHSECENGDRKGLTFWDVPEPIDISTTTPTFPATPPLLQAAASAPLCADATFTVAADATSITGSCFANSDQYGYEKYEWDFKLAGAAP